VGYFGLDMYSPQRSTASSRLKAATYTGPEDATDDGYFWITFGPDGTLAAAEISTGTVYLWHATDS
jgi:hypothetical protein